MYQTFDAVDGYEHEPSWMSPSLTATQGNKRGALAWLVPWVKCSITVRHPAFVSHGHSKCTRL